MRSHTLDVPLHTVTSDSHTRRSGCRGEGTTTCRRTSARRTSRASLRPSPPGAVGVDWRGSPASTHRLLAAPPAARALSARNHVGEGIAWHMTFLKPLTRGEKTITDNPASPHALCLWRDEHSLNLRAGGGEDAAVDAFRGSRRASRSSTVRLWYAPVHWTPSRWL